jgi:hypothetical protein
MELVHFLIKNASVKNGENLRQQVFGIPMGTSCAPLIANLYLDMNPVSLIAS